MQMTAKNQSTKKDHQQYLVHSEKLFKTGYSV